MCCCSFSQDDSVNMVNEKIVNAFPRLKGDIIYLQTTKSGDLFKADADECDGETVLNLAGSGCLYITTTQAQCEGQKAECSSSPVQVFVKPNIRKEGLPQLVVLPKPSELSKRMWHYCN